jgi:hypothetical protein
MSKKKKVTSSAINTEGWMMSYADMATILLAMFIVLSTLGKDQTGVNLYNGTGSFRTALDSFGLPGLFSNSSKVIQAETPNPSYQVGGEGDDPDPAKGGPDKGERGARVIDAEEERLQHFLGELNRRFPVEKMPKVAGQAIVDFFDPFNKETPLLTHRQKDVIWQVIPLLGQSKYRVTLVVWATTPAASAWTRAAHRAKQVVDEIVRARSLDTGARERLIPVGQPWRYPNFKRPIMSLVIAKTDR